MKLEKLTKHIPAPVKKFAKKAGKKILEKKPEICFIVGAAAIGIGVVEACKASRKLDDVIEDDVQELVEIKETPHEKNDQVYMKTLAGQYWTITKKGVLLYWKSALLITGGTYLVANGICTISADLAVMKSMYDHISNNVKIKYGEDEYNLMAFGNPTDIQKQVIEVKDYGSVDEKTIVEKEVIAPNLTKQFTFIFDKEHNSEWERFYGYNQNHAKIIDDNLTRNLHANGYLTGEYIAKEAGINLTKKELSQLLTAGIIWDGKDSTRVNLIPDIPENEMFYAHRSTDAIIVLNLIPDIRPYLMEEE